MLINLIYSILVLSFILNINNCSPLTLDIIPETEQCIYTEVPIKECVIKYYFNIQDWAYDDEFVDYSIYYIPSDTILNREHRLLKPKNDPEDERQVKLMTKTKQRIGEWQFTADEKGEYKICFLSKKHKIIDLDISHDCELSPYYDMNKNLDQMIDPLADDSVISLKEINDLAVDDKLRLLIENLDDHVNSLRTNLDYYRVRNARNLRTVESTLSRINWFSFGSMVIITSVCFIQVILIKYLFTRGLKTPEKYHKRL
ncbi:uncharacterized protein HGUI_01527 [Hanseniaspora guilliermondii]|uniref:GOLD domain-containing protein n=1 Tax=Hanseniaspora guilliermondii TaxID=56406 RepID=A0A1L0CWZ0_9ASCO|nr:uncharacterized protein HGUI_01527 [Hanseniaspora guilliermondii]